MQCTWLRSYLDRPVTMCRGCRCTCSNSNRCGNNMSQFTSSMKAILRCQYLLAMQLVLYVVFFVGHLLVLRRRSAHLGRVRCPVRCVPLASARTIILLASISHFDLFSAFVTWKIAETPRVLGPTPTAGQSTRPFLGSLLCFALCSPTALSARCPRTCCTPW